MDFLSIYHHEIYLHLHKYGKEYFEFESNMVRCIGNSLEKLDIHNEMPMNDDYFSKALELDGLDDLKRVLLTFIHNHKNYQYDNAFSLEEKRDILLQTIAFAKTEIFDKQSVLANLDSSLLKKYLNIFENLEAKINDDEMVLGITEQLDKLKLNFYIDFLSPDSGLEIKFLIYPIVFDILVDTFNQEYYAVGDRKLIKKFKTIFSSIEDAKNQKLLQMNSELYLKLHFFKTVLYSQIPAYIFHDHVRKLNVNPKDYHVLYREMFYYNIDSYKNSPSLKFDIKKTNNYFTYTLELTTFVI